MKMRGASVLAEMRGEAAPLGRESPGAAQARPEEGQMPAAPQERACGPDPPAVPPRSWGGSGEGSRGSRATRGMSPGSPRVDVWKAGFGSSWGEHSVP